MRALAVDLRDRTVLVVGGGAVAERRVRGLLEDGARIRLVSPEVGPGLAELADARRIAWIRRGFRAEDVDGAWLVWAHTDVPAVQAEVSDAAEKRRVFAVIGGDPEASRASTPARAAAGGVQVGVSAGRDPVRARRVAAWIQAQLETGLAPTRPQRPDAAWEAAQRPGTVALVGGGPGDPGLVTVRGRFLLAGADVVVADRLGPVSLLPHLAEHARIIDVGKRAGYHRLSQDRINATLVEQARLGLRVVRLKGGDPFVFGRGGEEEEYCAAHGVPVEVVPGITSAISVPAAAGIPVTHRNLSHGFSVVTAHEDLPVVPHAREHTLVLLMGVRRLPETSRRLIELGHDPRTPVAIIERGWTPEQRTTVGTLETIAELARRRDVHAPAVIVVGDVAAMGASSD
ncbi:uroporphyrinogen-III C-methyltransferase [Amycolatopsis sp. H6(2020)]|nr:uroporphyrinogen-III C-methyltransferase [Amycolatopsis sp. H6(2020)]